ncbi:MAG: cytochrome c3 family protein [Candidatus Zixiibacteriota bacterium]
MKTRTYLSGIILLLVLISPISAANVVVDEPSVCLVCHSEIEDLLGKKHQHTAFANGKCSSCHNPHASQHASLLNDDNQIICMNCHEEIGHMAEGGSIHGPVREGDCTLCHNPHASGFTSQLISPTTELCANCHTNVAEWKNRAVVHSPVEDGDCQVCHQPHNSNNPKLLVGDIPFICFDCHDRDESFNTRHKGYNMSKANCMTCHDPHATSTGNLLMENQHAPFKNNKCEICHKTSEGKSSFELVSDVKTICRKCHSSIGTKVDIKYTHNLNTEKSCLYCHNPHSSSGKSLLASGQSELCMGCHFSGPEFSVKKKSEYITHNSMDCSNCHSPHGSDNDRYLNADGMNLCPTCHVSAHKVSHPAGGNITDPRTQKQLTCLSCHKLHGANFENYLPLDPAMDLCIQCHKR